MTKSRALVLSLSVAVAIVVVPYVAHAKGASRATITGPGLTSPIELDRSSGQAIDRLAGMSGIYPALFETTPNPMLKRSPATRLGHRYEIAYVLKAPGFKANVVIQEVYPYAEPGPVTYVKPGQPTYDPGKSVGGWYRAGPSLIPFLVARGLPAPAEEDEKSPAKAQGSANAAADLDREGPGPPVSLVLGLLLVVSIAGALYQRRRVRSAHA